MKIQLELALEPIFHEDYFGYLPNKSALDAVGLVRKNCDTDWMLLYLERSLKAPIQCCDSIMECNCGTPPRRVIRPLLANLFMNYAFDKWLENNMESVRFCRDALKVMRKRIRSGAYSINV